jgi:hypothetical protein
MSPDSESVGDRGQKGYAQCKAQEDWDKALNQTKESIVE